MTMTFKINIGDEELEPFNIRYYCKSCFKRITLEELLKLS